MVLCVIAAPAVIFTNGPAPERDFAAALTQNGPNSNTATFAGTNLFLYTSGTALAVKYPVRVLAAADWY
jgi:hypothetical protein